MVDAGAGTAMPLMLCNGERATAQQLANAALFNYGHFTTLQVRDGAVRGLDLHLERLCQGNQALFDAALDAAMLREQMRDALTCFGSSDAGLRITIAGPMPDPRSGKPVAAPDLLITVSPVADMPTAGLHVQSTLHQRSAPQLKHVGIFAQWQLRRQALATGHDDAVFIDVAGQLLEGTFWNLGLWRQGRVVWPQGPALQGTQQRLLQAGLTALGIEQQTAPVSIAELKRFDGAFACNARGQQAIVAIDEQRWSDQAARLEVLAQALRTQPRQRI